MEKCQPVPLGVGIGAVTALYVGILGFVAMFGWGTALVETIGSLYIGFGASIGGALIGAVWGFIDGFIAGVVIAWVYNRMAKPAAG